MHYAEFGEDEVFTPRSLFPSSNPNNNLERGIARSYQRVRGEQVEGYWPKNWEASKGRTVLRSGL